MQFLGGEDPLEKELATHSIISPGKSHEQRSLGGYSLWGHKESDTTEQIHTRPEFLDSEGSLLRAWGLIPGRGTKIPQATQRSQKINRQIPVSYTEIVLICIFIFGIIKLIIKT